MGFLNRLSRRKKLLNFSIFLGYPKDAAVDILRSQADTHWSEPVRLWATYLAFVSFARDAREERRSSLCCLSITDVPARYAACQRGPDSCATVCKRFGVLLLVSRLTAANMG